MTRPHTDPRVSTVEEDGHKPRLAHTAPSPRKRERAARRGIATRSRGDDAARAAGGRVPPTV
jgi:hypothetical protein